jgi:serine/threonine protein kinase
MELCDLNLDNFIHAQPESTAYPAFPHFVRDTSPNIQAEQIWNVMKHIANGVVFIHGHGEVHRDLKPTNGTLNLSLAKSKCCGLVKIPSGNWQTLGSLPRAALGKSNSVPLPGEPRVIAHLSSWPRMRRSQAKWTYGRWGAYYTSLH